MAKFSTLFWLFLALSVLTVSFVRTQDDDNDAENEGDDDNGDDEETSDEDAREEDDVLVLTDDNFDLVVDKHDVMLLELYAPWCGHCKTLAPEYAMAAKTLKTSSFPVPLAKVDATVNQETAQRFDVSGFPTLKFKKEGQWLDFDGPRDAIGIVQWVQAKADPNYKPPPSAVVTVTSDNYDEFISSADLVLLEFYAPWCGHCKKIAPEYEKAAQSLLEHDPPIPLGKVDATVESDLASKFDVTGYPTLKTFRNGRPSDFKGPRDANGIHDYMAKQSGEAAKLLVTSKDVQNAIDKNSVTIIGFFDNLQHPSLRHYMDVANDKRDDWKFGYTLSDDARKLYKVNPSSVVVFGAERYYTKFEPKWLSLDVTDKSHDVITAFVEEKMLPMVGQLAADNEKFYAGHKDKTLCLAFYTVDWSFDYKDATQIWRHKVANIAKEYKSIKFAIVNEDDNVGDMFKDFGFEDSGEEFNFGCFKEKRKYPMEPMDEFDEDEIMEFLNKLEKNKLKPHIKSQPVPKRKEGPVKVVVGKTFDEVVLDPTKDVLIEIYAPWCGHCKKLEPIYKDLAKQLKKDKNVVIAKIDATANDLPENFSASGFPTIYYAAANNKENPIQYSGERTLDEIKEFLEKEATVSFGKQIKEEL